ncbi:MAG: 4a-hydroxytetrahydrobiopterin dehydratase [Actinomycetota bacterium]|nr:4a-hydroxytetrahydrobiopterin dehydratase [Actinomycetota bacterium]
MADPITAAHFQTLGLDDWRWLLGRIESQFRAGSFTGAAELVGAIATLADAADHHPDLDLRYPDRVHVVLVSHDAGGVTERDLELATAISALAAERAMASEPLASTSTEIGIDAMDIDAVRPFWLAVLGYEAERTPDGQQVVGIVDPLHIGPPVWFQQMDEPRPQRNRVHLDVTVTHDLADERVAGALAAGGTLLDDSHARAFWVLADPEGNEACVCTWQDRDRSTPGA